MDEMPNVGEIIERLARETNASASRSSSSSNVSTSLSAG